MTFLTDHIPATADIAEGLENLDVALEAELEQFQAEVAKKMESMEQDPRGALYYFRMDRKSIVKTEDEAVHCIATGIPLKTVTWNGAMQVLRQEDAKKVRAKKMKAKKKAAKKTKRKNR